ncbi:MAG TPA: DUF1461 domain-containing protein [Aggregatilineales bacterium]|nr:DUF1461 domain-containing protein [Aggregatilineales bacterium]
MLKRLLAFVLALMVPPILILLCARLIMTEPYLSFEYHKPDFPADPYGFTLDDRLHYAPYAVRYVFNTEGIDYLRNITLPDGSALYTERELSHLQDVKGVVQLLFGGLIIVMCIAAAKVVLLWRLDRRVLWSALLTGSTLTLVLLAGSAVFVLTRWDSFFDRFHELFFSGGNWVFNFSDDLIRLYPVRFWQDGALTLGLLSAVAAAGLLAVSARQLRRS